MLSAKHLMVFTVILITAAGFSLWDEQTPTARIYGYITESEHSSPLLYSVVAVYDDPDSMQVYMGVQVLERDGYYEITGIPPGTYTVRVTLVGAYTEYEEITLEEDDSIQLNFALELTPNDGIWYSPSGETIETAQHDQHSWCQSHMSSIDGNTVYREDFLSSENIDWLGFPGELRLSMPRHSVLDSLQDTEARENLNIEDSAYEPFDFILENENNELLFLRHHDYDLYPESLRSKITGADDITSLEEWTFESLLGSIQLPFYVRIGDVLNIGRPEALVFSQSDDIVTVFTPFVHEDRSIEWETRVIQDTTFNLCTIEISDLDGNGWNDIILAGDSVSIWLNSGTREGWERYTLQSSFHESQRVLSCDIDGDGDTDLLVSGEKRISWFVNSGEYPLSWREILIDPERDGPIRAIGFFDIDSNGENNVVSLMDDNVIWWEPRYAEEGKLISEVFSLRGSPVTMSVDWSGTVASSQTSDSFPAIGLMVRSSPFQRTLQETSWSELIKEPGKIFHLVEPEDRYMQYMVLLHTSNPDTTPVLHRLTFTWTYKKPSY